MPRETDTVLFLLGGYALYRAYSAGSDAVSAVVQGAKDVGRAIKQAPDVLAKQTNAELGEWKDAYERRVNDIGPRFDGSDEDERNAVGRMLISETTNQEAWPWMIASVIRWSKRAGKSVEQILAPHELGGTWGKHYRDGTYVYAATNQKATKVSLAAYDAAAQNWDRFLAAHPDVISFVEGSEQYKGHIARNPELVLHVKVGQWYFLKRRDK